MAGTGGDPPLSYSLTGFPLGLSFDPATRRLTGSISQQARTDTPYDVRYEVIDADGDRDPETFRWTITDRSPTAPSIASRASLVGQNVGFTIDEGTGGDPPLVYSIPASQLPPGIAFNPVTRLVSGIVGGERNVYTITLTVTDNDGSTGTRTFTWSVTLGEPMAPTVGDLANTVGSGIDIILPEGVGGDPPLVYTLTGDPSLPPGTMFDAATRRLHGIVGGVEQTYTMTYTVFDVDGQSHSVTFLWNVTDPDLVPTAPVLPDLTNRIGDELDFELSEGSGGDPPLSYTLAGLPLGLQFDSASRRITGIIVGSPNIYDVEYTVQDEDGDSDITSFEWDVMERDDLPRLPTISDRVSDLGYVAGASPNDTLPVATSGNPPYTYSLSNLPPDLVFDPASRRITGIIVGAPGIYEVEYVAQDEDGDRGTTSYEWEVLPADNVPRLPTIFDRTDPQGFRVENEPALPEATNGTPPYRYSIEGLPPGLEFDPVTRLITGTLE